MKSRKNLPNVLLIAIFLLFNILNAIAQIDSSAVAILDKMSFAVGNLQSCSLTLKAESDKLDQRLGYITNTEVSKIILKAPDKFYISKSGDRGNKEIYYDGKNFIFYSKDNNLYSSFPAPPTIMQTIDTIHNTFGIDFPAADFFYPYFVDDLLEISDNLSYLGETTINSKECYHIAGTTIDVTYQIWIANDGSFLPVKLRIISNNPESDKNYSALYENWEINPVIQNSMFEFIAPADALKVKLAVKK